MKSFELEVLAKKVVKPLHRSAVSGRRVKILSHHLSQLLPRNENLIGLDVGCGSGELANNIQQLCPQVKMFGLDVSLRSDAIINITTFDGNKLPFEDKSYDFTMLVDVLHHTDNPTKIMQECCRVTRKFILLKDHICESGWDRIRLSFMDWIGNRAYDVYLPYNYLSKKDWEQLYKASKIQCETEVSKLNLYPQPFSYIFDSSLHFVTKLAISEDLKK